MTHPQKTYELVIVFDQKNASTAQRAAVKNDVKEWLTANGVESFVEGSIDGLDIDNEFTGEYRDFYSELGGDHTPISIYKYSLESLVDLQAKVQGTFRERITTALKSMDTQVWLEGWKESFLPITTEKFYVYPPWNKDQPPTGKIAIEIEPGIAFGTGQHATTQVCLRRIEAGSSAATQWNKVLDVGTGTAILAIAIAKLHPGIIIATDIDPDAVIAARRNVETNQCMIQTFEMSVPNNNDPRLPQGAQPPYDFVIANILTVVLEKIVPDLARVVAPRGKLLLSGILSEDGDMMIQKVLNLGLKLVHRTDLEGWACLEFERIG